MRNKVFFLSVMVILAVILSACDTAYAQESNSDPRRTITVTGTGEVLLSPDIAYVSIGVRSEGEDAAKTVAENNTKTAKVVEAVISFGVDENDIQTTNFNIHPQHQYDEQGSIQDTLYVWRTRCALRYETWRTSASY